MIVHDDYVVVVHDEGRVADDGKIARANGVVDALADLVEAKRLAGVLRAHRLARLRSERDESDQHDGGQREQAAH